MSKSKTQTAVTTHGTVEYETVTCDSCGDEVAKEDAYQFVLIGDLKNRRSRHDYVRFEAYDGKFSEGYACPYCADVGPIDYPEEHWTERLWNHPTFRMAFIDKNFGGYDPMKLTMWGILVTLFFIGVLEFLA